MRSSVTVSLVLVAACAGPNLRVPCAADAECLQDGVSGVCLPSPESEQSWCAFETGGCLRWGVLAGDGLAGQCVAGGPVGDGGTDGGDGGTATFTLTVQRTGGGDGTVISLPNGISCGTACSVSFSAGEPVTLMATPGAGSSFVGWNGDCRGVGACTVVMDRDRAVEARFALPGEVLWHTEFGGVRDECGQRVAIDPAGDVIVSGVFRGTLEVGDTTLSSVDEFFDDAFVAKLSQHDGTPFWAVSFANDDGSFDDLAYVGPAPGGDVWVGVTLFGTATFAGMTFSAASRDVLLLRLAGSDGSLVTAYQLGGSNHETLMGLATDPAGDVHIVGHFSGGSTSLGGIALTGRSALPDVFLARIREADGSAAWARSFGSAGVDLAEAISLNSAGDLAITGTYGDTADFGGPSTLSFQAGATNSFVARYQQSDGGHRGSRGLVGSARDVALAPDSSVVGTGYFTGTSTLGGIAPVSSAGSTDVFAVAYAASAGLPHAWSHRHGGGGNDEGHAVSVGAAGDLLLVGFFAGNVEFGGASLTASGAWDGYVVKQNPDGIARWAQAFGGVMNDEINGVAIDAAERIFVAGCFEGSASIGGATVIGNGGGDILVVGVAP